MEGTAECHCFLNTKCLSFRGNICREAQRCAILAVSPDQSDNIQTSSLYFSAFGMTSPSAVPSCRPGPPCVAGSATADVCAEFHSLNTDRTSRLRRVRLKPRSSQSFWTILLSNLVATMFSITNTTPELPSTKPLANHLVLRPPCTVSLFVVFPGFRWPHTIGLSPPRAAAGYSAARLDLCPNHLHRTNISKCVSTWICERGVELFDMASRTAHILEFKHTGSL